MKARDRGWLLDLAAPLAKELLRESLVLGRGQDGGSVGCGEELPCSRGGTTFPVPRCIPVLYTSLFISIQNHVSILHKEHPTLLPTLSHHFSALALGRIPPGGGA